MSKRYGCSTNFEKYLNSGVKQKSEKEGTITNYRQTESMRFCEDPEGISTTMSRMKLAVILTNAEPTKKSFGTTGHSTKNCRLRHGSLQ
ncbi:unnamed protein product [Allacma fusca]|uniref:Uncharacterized protein n=1 Tax=Allacma fusca TaxID=39272 RepID=A0A8J2J9I8_9HEXA|nr:unnamed protein product [Allacma fusca]